MRVPGDHTPVSQGTAECNHPLCCPPYIYMGYVHVSIQDESVQPPWNVTWGHRWPHLTHLKWGAVLHGLSFLHSWNWKTFNKRKEPFAFFWMVHSISILWENGWCLVWMHCMAFPTSPIWNGGGPSSRYFPLLPTIPTDPSEYVDPPDPMWIR